VEERVYCYGYAEKSGVRWFDCAPLWSGLARTCAWSCRVCCASPQG
jgi:hypothetical protein